MRTTLFAVICFTAACSSDPKPDASTVPEDTAAPAPVETAAPQDTAAEPPSTAAPTATASASAAPSGISQACKTSADCDKGSVCCGSSEGMLGTNCAKECNWMSQSLACATDADCKSMPTTAAGVKIKVEGCKAAASAPGLKFCKFAPAK